MTDAVKQICEYVFDNSDITQSRLITIQPPAEHLKKQAFGMRVY